MGGGFGFLFSDFESFMDGWFVSTVLNKLNAVANTSTSTVIHLAMPGAELYLHTTRHDTGVLRLLLSPAFVAVRDQASAQRS